ncbi:TPA: viral A-type inclusion protein, partial [Clostridium botulinum]|nr:viral A-type inclusion protein [Clostridium botulinum]
MSDIHNLEIDVDLKENLIITATCKQLDNLNLIFNIWNNGEMADLTEYKCRLKAFKQDQIPLIQNTDIKISNNVITIDADEQLTTTSGIIKAELQFINKNTSKKKSTFNIIFKVMQSVLEVERSISKATCTLLKEIDNKLDRIEDIGDVLEEAKEVRDTLTNKTIPTATNINSALVSNIKNADTKKKEVENIISNASDKIVEVNKSITDANTSKSNLDKSKINADTTKENLDVANVQAEKNIEELNKIGDAKDLAAKVETNKNNIENLQEKVDDNTS